MYVGKCLITSSQKKKPWVVVLAVFCEVNNLSMKHDFKLQCNIAEDQVGKRLDCTISPSELFWDGLTMF